MTKKEEEYIKVQKILVKSIRINKALKEYKRNDIEYKKLYNQKKQLLNAAINKIETYSLPIKYGIGINENDKIATYFQINIDKWIEQLSFRGIYGTKKTFHGIWKKYKFQYVE